MDIMHLINRKQNGVTITVGPFGSIDRELFKIVNCQTLNDRHISIYFMRLYFIFSDYKQSLFFCYVFAQFYCINPHRYYEHMTRAIKSTKESGYSTLKILFIYWKIYWYFIRVHNLTIKFKLYSSTLSLA